MNEGHIGLITHSYGRQFIVEIAGISYSAITKSKKTEYVVGDQVIINPINQQQVQIIELLPRHNLIYRTDQNRSKIIASNISQLLIVIAIKPNFNLHFLNSCLLSAEAEQISPIILINKTDLLESTDFIAKINALYAVQLGYKVVCLSALDDCSGLKKLLNNKSSLLIGQSGVGKSTITNQIVPGASTRTARLSKSENSGCHTTTNATLYHINKTSSLIDCPGLQEFGLYHLQLDNLTNLFPEFRQYSNLCKFRNCRHINEPGCAITTAFRTGTIDPERFNLFHNLTCQLQQKLNY